MEFSKHTLAGYRYKPMSIKLDTVYAIYAFILTCGACIAGSIGGTSLMLIITAMFAPLVFKPEYLLGPVLFFTIFDDFLLVGSSASASRFLTLFFMAGAVFSILKRGSIRKVSLYFLLLTALGVVLSFYSTLGYTTFPISYILNVLLAAVMVNFAVATPEEFPKRLYAYAVLALAYVYFLLWRNGFESLVDGTRMSISEDVNSNALAMGLAIAMTLQVCNLLLLKKNMFLNVLLIGANLVALFLTGSRTSLIAAIVTSFLLYIINVQDSRSKRNAFILLIVSSILLVFIYNTLQKHFPILMERFTVDNVEETGASGRVDVWSSFFLHLFPKHWLIGMGFSPTNLYYGIGALNAEAHGAHNMLVDILSRTGIVGLTLYCVCFVKFFITTGKNLQTNKSLLLPIAIVTTTLINGIGENVLTGRFLWFGIGLGYLLINTGIKEKEKLSGGDHDA